MRVASFVRAILLAVCASSAAQGTETIQFVWRDPSADIPGQIGKAVAYPVHKGRGTGGHCRPRGRTCSLPHRGGGQADAQRPTGGLRTPALRGPDHRPARAHITDQAEPLRGHKVLVGQSRLTQALGLSTNDFQPQEYLLRTYGNILVLMGHDDPDYGMVHYDRHDLWDRLGNAHDGGLEPERARKLGTCYAVHEFLRRFCGVRWYLPGELGEVCPARPTIQVKGHRPQAPAVDPIPMDGHPRGGGRITWPRAAGSLRDVFLWRLRTRQFGGEAFGCNHSLVADWVRKRFPDAPDLLARGHKNPTQLCLSSPKLLRIICQDADDYFAGRTNYARARATTSRSCRTTHTRTARARHASSRSSRRHRAGASSGAGRTSNYVWGLVNRVARHVRQTHPGKWVGCCSYAAYTLYRTRRTWLSFPTTCS